MSQDEVWIQRDGSRINVGDMDEHHVRNTLRMLLRKDREIRERARHQGKLDIPVDADSTIMPWNMGDLANPHSYFPLLGRFGSPELAEKYRRKRYAP